MKDPARMIDMRAGIAYNVGRQALPVESSLATAYRSEGGDRMTDYEMLMIVLTILTLLVMASKRSDR